MTRPYFGNSYGILMSVFASGIFAAMPIYVQIFQPMPGYAITAQRVVWSVILMLAGQFFTGRLVPSLTPLISPRLLPGLLLTSAIIGIQMWLFIWAPLNGRTVELSLGYFLLPLVMVGVGRIFFGEKLRPCQWFAVIAAVMGVGSAYLRAGGLSWVVLVVALGFPVYYIIRRGQPLSPLDAFCLENILLLPVSIWGILHFGNVHHPFAFPWEMLLRFAGLGLLGTIPVVCMLTAGRRLPLGLFGLLSYLEPGLIFLVSLFVLGESVSQDEIFTYQAILTALGLLAIDGIFQIRQQGKVLQSVPKPQA
ncbi:EamA family transporter RarD [Desulfocicer vacuolatum]|uniref:EamA family transporter RarD n=1 Tax=Desulfocicer vacuolatum TaxID=2298 RepID=UPI001482BF3A|nr:EamA family transporter RarD [Desulfocicer vacuolatum]